MTLILLQGLPATGKTSIGCGIANTLNIPFFSKDTYKEILFDSLPNEQTMEWSQALGATSFDVLYATIKSILQGQQSCVVDAYWNPERAAPQIHRILEKTGAGCVQIFCYADLEILMKRFTERAKTDRHPAHMDTARAYPNHPERNKPLDLPGKLLIVDTTDFSNVSIPDIINKLSLAASSHASSPPATS